MSAEKLNSFEPDKPVIKSGELGAPEMSQSELPSDFESKLESMVAGSEKQGTDRADFNDIAPNESDNFSGAREPLPPSPLIGSGGAEADDARTRLHLVPSGNFADSNVSRAVVKVLNFKG